MSLWSVDSDKVHDNRWDACGVFYCVEVGDEIPNGEMRCGVRSCWG